MNKRMILSIVLGMVFFVIDVDASALAGFAQVKAKYNITKAAPRKYQRLGNRSASEYNSLRNSLNSELLKNSIDANKIQALIIELIAAAPARLPGAEDYEQAFEAAKNAQSGKKQGGESIAAQTALPSHREIVQAFRALQQSLGLKPIPEDNKPTPGISAQVALNKVRNELYDLLVQDEVNEAAINKKISALAALKPQRRPQPADFQAVLAKKLALSKQSASKATQAAVSAPKKAVLIKPPKFSSKPESAAPSQAEWTQEYAKIAAYLSNPATITKSNLTNATQRIKKLELNPTARNKEGKTLEQIAREGDELYRTAHDGLGASEAFEAEWNEFIQALQ